MSYCTHLHVAEDNRSPACTRIRLTIQQRMHIHICEHICTHTHDTHIIKYSREHDLDLISESQSAVRPAPPLSAPLKLKNALCWACAWAVRGRPVPPAARMSQPAPAGQRGAGRRPGSARSGVRGHGAVKYTPGQRTMGCSLVGSFKHTRTPTVHVAPSTALT